MKIRPNMGLVMNENPEQKIDSRFTTYKSGFTHAVLFIAS
jgi:hypothetical protein